MARGLLASERDICDWDVSTWAPAITFWQERIELQGRRCLELGARLGGLSLWLALNKANVLCSDLWGSDRAAPLHQRYNVEVAYEDIDATQIPYAAAFDIVVFKSMLGALQTFDRQRLAIEQIYKALKPGGALLFAENLAGSPMHGLLRRYLRQWATTWRYVSLHEMGDLLRPFSSVEFRTAGVVGRSVDRVIRHLCPPAWRYVIYGVAIR